MAEGANIGNAYVTVKPELDKGAASRLKTEGESIGSGFGSKFSGAAHSVVSAGAVMMGNILAQAAMAAASKIGEVFMDTFKNYANYEQLVGGVDTLFKESSDVVQANAARAFESAGMSANQYMETVTSFSASLLQGLGGDTAAAAAYADTAIRDMSDNANKMGTDMQRIQDAYQGFAKQNYTMLDNLKLGYGGTKTEMERLLADAEALSGVHYDIDNYSDVIQAIHVIQENMGIAGTTAEEAEHTISGSLNSMKAAWENLLTGFLDDNADMGELFNNFIKTAANFASNLAPRFGVAFVRIFQQLPNAIANSLRALPDKLLPTLQSVFGEELGQKIYESLGAGIDDLLGAFDKVAQVVQIVWPTIEEIISGAVQAIGEVVSVAFPLIAAVIDTVMQAVLSVFQFVWPVIEVTVSRAIEGIIVIIQGLAPIVSFVTGIFEGIKAAIVDPVETAKNLIKAAIDAIKGFFNFKIQWPHIPLPHFSISGSANPLDWLTQGVPNISIEWYKAGGFVDGATLIGAGEAGPEMILPKSGGLMTDFAEAVAREDDDELIIRWLSRNLGNIIATYTPTLSRRDFDRMARQAVV